MPKLFRRTMLAGLAAAVAGAVVWRGGPGRQHKAAQALSATPLPAPHAPLRVYHLGHSLVGRDMPAMLAQLAGDGHRYDSQLGWGTSLKEHWEPALAINGFAEANDHPRFRAAREAVASGEYDALVLTEMVEIRDAIRHHDSAGYLARWAKLARRANPAARVYLYETWHHTDDGHGWLARIDGDLRRYWQDRVKDPAVAGGAAVHLIPAGQVLAALVREIEAKGGVPGIAQRDDLFARRDDGTPDTIHINDLGAYLVALTHYAVLYHRPPAGLPHALRRADGSLADAPSAEAAALMQRIVWQVVASQPETGVAA